MRTMPFDDSRTISQAQIKADQNAVTAWLAKNSPVKIDSLGHWMRGGKLIKKAALPDIDPIHYQRWPGGKP
jgi:hypothetical protein